MASTARATPWHLWAVGALGLAWNGFGVYDYVMSKTVGEPYFRQLEMTDAQIAHMASFPALMTAIWAIGVWGALLGTVLLLLRNRLAAPVFAVSLAAYLASLVYSHLLSDGAKVMGNMAFMQWIVLAGCLFFAWYARTAARSGALR
jgi:ABC-type enterochelin transport system permease subunit